MGSGVLDEEDFRRCCRLLLLRSEQLGDGWSWEGVQGSEEGYLRKTALRSVVMDPTLVWDQEGSGSDPSRRRQQSVDASVIPVESDMEDDDDVVHTAPEGSSRLLQYEYHILHSCSYAAPVLYFRASTQEGRSLSSEEVWSSVHPNFRLRLQSSPLNAISLQEHPLLGQPFFMLHPCRTEEFMRPLLQAAEDQSSLHQDLQTTSSPPQLIQTLCPDRSVNYVLSWLSVVGPVVGLDVPLKYSTHTLSSTKPDEFPDPQTSDCESFEA